MFLRRSLCLVSVLALSLGCDGETPSETDAGFDAGEPPDAGWPLACESVREVTGVLDDTVSIAFDTSLVETRPRDLGLACGNAEAELRWAPQEVVEFSVPGDPGTSYAVEFTTNLPGTQMDFNTVVQARDSCESVPASAFPPRCFDDVAMGAYQTTGSVLVPGGSTLYFFVTGYSEPPADQMTVDRGTVEVGFTVREGQPPTVDSGSLLLANDDVRIQLSGTDGNADVRGVAMNYYAGGELLDIYGDGAATEDGDIFVVRFDDPPAVSMNWTGGAWVRAADINLGPYLRNVGATEVQFRVFDAAWGVSDPLRVPIEEADLVGLGEACDDETICRPEMVCSTAMCIPSAQVASLCDGATELDVSGATPAMGVTVSMVSNTGAGEGLVSVPPDCVGGDGVAGIGAERLYRVDVAVDDFDMTVSTANAGSGMTDTILYVRSQCPDSGTLLGCNDDVAPGTVQSTLELNDLTAGTYWVFVERYRGLAMGTIPHEISVEITPIVPSGMPCDAATTRCASGSCTAGMCP